MEYYIDNRFKSKSKYTKEELKYLFENTIFIVKHNLVNDRYKYHFGVSAKTYMKLDRFESAFRPLCMYETYIIDFILNEVLEENSLSKADFDKMIRGKSGFINSIQNKWYNLISRPNLNSILDFVSKHEMLR